MDDKLGTILMKIKIIKLLFIIFSCSVSAENEITEQPVIPSTSSAVQNQKIPVKLTDAQRKELIMQEAGNENWSRVFELILPLAQKGDREAQANLGLLYAKGSGVEQDFAKAHWWFNEAAEKGSVKALNNLAVFYFQGLGVAKNIPHSAKLFEYSASSGSQDAMVVLAQIYKTELKQPKNAFKWFKKAAEVGNYEAKYHLALMYEQGEGTKKNKKQAIYWYQQVLKQEGDLTRQAEERLTKLVE